jgi:molecular chaperone Hsp33
MLKKDMYGGSPKERLKASDRDRLHRFTMAGGTLRGAVVHATRMIGEMRANHDLGPVETLLLGHGYIAAALLSATLKGRDRVSIQLQCSGPVRGMEVEANVFGEVRGFLKNPRFSLQAGGRETSLSSFLGAGFLTVTRYLEEARTPYSGRVALEYGSLAEDLAAYFLQSEQTPTAFNLSVHFDDQGRAVGAGGLMLQAMPGAEAATVAEAEKALAGMPSLGREFSRGVLPGVLVQEVFQRFHPVLTDNLRVEFFCRCTREKLGGT